MPVNAFCSFVQAHHLPYIQLLLAFAFSEQQTKSLLRLNMFGKACLFCFGLFSLEVQLVFSGAKWLRAWEMIGKKKKNWGRLLWFPMSCYNPPSQFSALTYSIELSWEGSADPRGKRWHLGGAVCAHTGGFTLWKGHRVPPCHSSSEKLPGQVSVSTPLLCPISVPPTQ